MLPPLKSLLFLFIAAFASVQSGWAQSSERSMIADKGSSTDGVEVKFRYKAFELGDKERARLAALLASIRRDWCYVEAVIAVAHSDASEGTAVETTELAKRRAQSMHDLLRGFGVNETLMFFEARGSSRQPSRPSGQLNATAEVEVVGRKCSGNSPAHGADLLNKAVVPVQSVRPWQEGVK